MKKKQIAWIAGIIILIVAFLLGDVQIQLGTYSPQASTKSITKQLTNIQNISGAFFRSPGESLSRELASFSTTQHNLDLRTYEFTEKDFKTTLEKLAQNKVNIRIIVEDNKFQQYRNTLKVLSQDFS